MKYSTQFVVPAYCTRQNHQYLLQNRDSLVICWSRTDITAIEIFLRNQIYPHPFWLRIYLRTFTANHTRDCVDRPRTYVSKPYLNSQIDSYRASHTKVFHTPLFEHLLKYCSSILSGLSAWVLNAYIVTYALVLHTVGWACKSLSFYTTTKWRSRVNMPTIILDVKMPHHGDVILRVMLIRVNMLIYSRYLFEPRNQWLVFFGSWPSTSIMHFWVLEGNDLTIC